LKNAPTHADREGFACASPLSSAVVSRYIYLPELTALALTQ
jgi:hypothetical protein